PKQRHASLSATALRRFRDDAEHPADCPGLVAHGVVGHVEVGFLEEPIALEFQQEDPGPERLAGVDYACEQLVQLAVPDLAPRLATRESERLRMFPAKDRTIRVVVE